LLAQHVSHFLRRLIGYITSIVFHMMLTSLDEVEHFSATISNCWVLHDS